MNKSKFVRRNLALKGGKSKAEYIAEAKAKGLKVSYSGKVVYDNERNLVREKGFFVTPDPILSLRAELRRA